MDNEKTVSHAGMVVTVGVVLLVLVYFLVPVVFTVPAIALAKKGVLPEKVVPLPFMPVIMLYDRFPSYKALLDRQCEFCEAHGWAAK